MAWVKLDDMFASHPKVVDAGPLALAMQVAALCYCNHHLTDGRIGRPAARTLVDFDGLHGPGGAEVTADDVIAVLVEVGMWHGPGHGCDDCPEVVKGYVIHDYLEQQPSRAEVLAKREQTAEAGRRGGKARAAKRAAKRSASEPPTGTPDGTPSDGSSGTEADGQANVQAKSKPVPGPVPTPVEPQGQDPSRPTPDDAGPDDRRSWADKAADFPEVVHDLTRQFAEGVKANGAKIPKADTKAQHDWLQAFDRLLRKGAPGGDDEPTDPAEVARVIGWVLADEFERTVVLSPGKFRARYPQLRLKALAPPRRNGGGRGPVAPAPADANWRAGWSGGVAGEQEAAS